MQLAPLIARNWPFPNGSGRIIDKFAGNVDLGAGEVVANTSDGFPIHVLADDHIGRHILLSGRFDRSIVQCLLDRARPGDVLVDIGANIGYVSACFLARVEGSRAVCVEPQPVVVDLLAKNMGQFSGRAVVHQLALSDRTGELRFHVNEENRGASRIAADGEVRVPTVSGAEFLGSLDRVDLVKIDVEGHEAAIFRSIEGELRRLRPRGILFEQQDDGASPEGEIGTILRRAGYSVFGIDKQLFKTALAPVRSKADCRYNDYMALAD